MNGNDVINMYEDYHKHSQTVVCFHCKKSYQQEREEQISGFRDIEYDYCPYCHKSNDKSMTYEYHNYPISENQIVD